MNFDEPIDTENRVFVPVKVRQHLTSLIKSVTRIVISEIAGDRTRKVNGIGLTTRLGQLPSDSIDEIAQAVTQVMHHAWMSQETDDEESADLPPMEFVIVCEYWLTSPKKKRVRNQFTYTYHASPEEDYDEVNNNVETHAILQVLEQYKSLTGQLMAHNNEMADRMVQVSAQQTATAAAGADMLRQAIPMFLGGSQAMLNAKYMEYSIRRADLEAEQSGNTLRSVLATVSPMLPILGMQILSKMGFDPSAVSSMMNQGGSGDDDEDDGDDLAANARSARTQDAGSSPMDYASVVDSDEPIPKDGRLAMLANAFGNSLRTDQQRALNQTLTKKQRAAFDDLFCAKTDAEAYAAYQVVAATCLDKLGELQGMLDQQQLQALQAFMGGAAQFSSR